jgi:predicted nucleic-acid-binding Zn-ribbon protein
MSKSAVEVSFSYAKNGKNEAHILALLLKLQDFVETVSIIKISYVKFYTFCICESCKWSEFKERQLVIEILALIMMFYVYPITTMHF